MSTYLLINIAVIAIPLALSFDKRILFYRRWPAVFSATGIVGAVYVFWDVAATATGHWWFNPQHTSSMKILFLPFEEILFFMTTPFSCLFIYEVVCYYNRDKTFKLHQPTLHGIAFTVFVAGLILIHYHYTALSLFSLGLFLWITTRYFFVFLSKRNFWIYMIICYAPFALVNSILTGLPIVEYAPSAILGWRLETIPLEDFIYNFSYLGFTGIIYQYLLGKSVIR